jgi:PDZ domain
MLSSNPFRKLAQKLNKKPSSEKLQAGSAAESVPLVEAPVSAAGVDDYLFADDKLGLRLMHTGSQVAVIDTVPGSEANRLGVQPGDILLELNGQAVKTPDGFVAALTQLRRPVSIKFKRPPPQKAAAITSSFKRAQDTARAKFAKPAAPAPLTDAERATQREAMLRAAEARGAAWDKKLQKGRQTTSSTVNGSDRRAASPEPNSEQQQQQQQHPETQRVVELCRTQEQATASQLGYNPYEAKLTGVSEARQAVANSTAAAAAPQQPMRRSSSSSGLHEQLAVSEEEEATAMALIEEADDALLTVMSCGDVPAAGAALNTLHTLVRCSCCAVMQCL